LEITLQLQAFSFLIPPTTFLYSNSRHSSAPLKSGVRLNARANKPVGVFPRTG